jgi:anti-anti-sigma factor
MEDVAGTAARERGIDVQNGNKHGHLDPGATAGPGLEDAAPIKHSATTEPGSPVQVTDGSPAVDASEPASVHVIAVGDRTRIVVSGEIDADLAPDLQDAASDAETAGLPIEVDAQHVTFMDSSGIAFLARLASRSASRVRVLHAPDTVRFLLEVTRIGELLDLVDEEGSTVADPDPRVDPAPPGPDDAA